MKTTHSNRDVLSRHWQPLLRATLCCGMASAFALGVPNPVSAQGMAPSVISAPSIGSSNTIDYANARPKPLPVTSIAPPSLLDVLLNAQAEGGAAEPPSVTPGRAGNGRMTPVRLAPAKSVAATGSVAPQPEQFGTAAQPFTTSRSNASGNITTNFYPFSAAGKLFFNDGASTFVCSAALIRRGLVVTAAHCVSQFGANRFFTNFRFVPAYNNGAAPYGTWTAAAVRALNSYLRGTEVCAQRGVVCPNDVAVITLTPQAGAYPGPRTGWFGVGVNGFSYNASGQVLITQLGYPVALDGGLLQQRTDSQGFTAASLSSNTVIGSLQTGGSSGGPWVVNLGIPPVLSGVGFGTAAAANVVVGVTSWGYGGTGAGIKQQGASRFTATNITALVNAACTATPAACS